MKNVLLYEIGHFGGGLYLSMMKEGSQDMIFQRISFFDNSVSLGKAINTRAFIDDMSIDNWACRPFNEDRLVCAFIFLEKGGYLVELKYTEKKKLEIVKKLNFELYQGIIVR